MQIELHAPGTLKINERNSRAHSKADIKLIARSIEQFGWTNPVLVSDDLSIIAGEGRVRAALLLNLAEVPIVRLSHLTEDEQRAYIIADNQLAARAKWKPDILAVELQGLVELGFDVELTGFEIAQVDAILKEERGKRVDDIEMPLPLLRTKAVVLRGELWRLGNHYLYCGDARDRTCYTALMRGQQAQMVITDPPYNVPNVGFTGGKGLIKHRDFAMAAGEMSREQFTEFLIAALRLLAEFSKDGSIHYVFMDWRHALEILTAGMQVYGELKNRITWVKDNGGMGAFYRSRHEDVYVFKNGSAPHINTFELGQHGRSRTNVWEYPGVNTMRAGRLEELAMHPTVKPVAMIADALRDCSKPKGLILDPFAGSGSTLIAAEMTGRHARVMEIDPLYCDLIIRRWQAFSGKEAIHVSTGNTFAQIATTFVADDAA